MTSRDFCYWLQGFFEIDGEAPAPAGKELPGLTERQVECIRRHLALVFKHEIDPSAGPPAHQAELDHIHDGQAAPVKLPDRPHPSSAHDIRFRC